MAQQAQRTIGFSGSSGEKETSHGSSIERPGASLSPLAAVVVGLSNVVEAWLGYRSDDDMRRKQPGLRRALSERE